jgi:hypothetical protein
MRCAWHATHEALRDRTHTATIIVRRYHTRIQLQVTWTPGATGDESLLRERQPARPPYHQSHHSPAPAETRGTPPPCRHLTPTDRERSAAAPSLRAAPDSVLCTASSVLSTAQSRTVHGAPPMVHRPWHRPEERMCEPAELAPSGCKRAELSSRTRAHVHPHSLATLAPASALATRVQRARISMSTLESISRKAAADVSGHERQVVMMMFIRVSSIV